MVIGLLFLFVALVLFVATVVSIMLIGCEAPWERKGVHEDHAIWLFTSSLLCGTIASVILINASIF